ncbi:MAG: carboxypeptidase-like regulatory domain-containing protein [Planctomycetaceae bacterium]|jgi:hypothetical protein|nr:carboxypeptidase-like regulatory domain-containing protein [Planctomycetaceae bacterium]
MLKKTIFCFALTAILLLFSGCGNGKYGLSGKVTLTDGTPLSGGEVYFQKDAYEARGTLKPDGTYVVGSISEKDGLPKGKYNVYVYIFGQQKLIDKKYSSPNTSGITVEVPVPGGKFDFQVEPYKR